MGMGETRKCVCQIPKLIWDFVHPLAIFVFKSAYTRLVGIDCEIGDMIGIQ